MRLIWTLAALALLSGCDRETPAAPPAVAGQAEALYDFRLPAQRVRAVLQSNADGCTALGPARCRLVSAGYAIDDRNRVEAMLALRIDPSDVRRFGEAVGTVVVDAGGMLEASALGALERDALARDEAMLGRLRAALDEAETSTAADAGARAVRIRQALAIIAEVEARAGQTLATAPLRIRYRSVDTLPGPTAAERRLQGLGSTLGNAAAELLQLLARLAPWLLLMLGVALLLRWILRDMPVGRPRRDVVRASAAPPPADPPWPPRTRTNPMHRWFARDEEEARRD